MSANDLLYWMSARGQGSWQQFRSAVEELDMIGGENGLSDQGDAPSETFPLYQTLRLNLQRLAHAEFFGGASDQEWRIAPPTLAISPTEKGLLGVLTGARSLKLMERFSAAAKEVSQTETSHFPACPDQISIIANDQHTARSIAQKAALFVQENAPMAILASLPSIDHPAALWQAELPFGADWRVERFSANRMKWIPSNVEEGKSGRVGLFRFSHRHNWLVLLCSRGRVFEVPSAVGKYLVLRARRRRHVLSYDVPRRVLSIPAVLRPPFLIERALILCSGKLPTESVTDDRKLQLEYSGIPRETALLACGLLRQEIA